MNNFERILRMSFRRRGGSAAAGFLLVFSSLLLLAGLVAGAASAAEVQPTSANSVGPQLQYTVGDFDGDLRPDLVGVEVGKSGFSGTQYWIELQLSAAGQQRIPIFALTGGIQIAARDVNGDQSLDLVLTSAWLNQPIAVLLNDGHGTFTRVDSSAFPDAFRECKTNWESDDELARESVGAPPNSRAGIFLVTLRSPIARSQIGSPSRSRRSLFLSQILTSQSGRAPPFQSSLL